MQWPEAVVAIRLLAATGFRRIEVLNLRWRDIGGDAISLPDSKSEQRAMPPGEAARAHLPERATPIRSFSRAWPRAKAPTAL